MTYTQHYDSPLGGILLAADEEGLTGLWFDGQKYFARTLPKEYAESETPVLCEAKRWLDIYFSGREPDFTPQLHPRVRHSSRQYGRCCWKFPMAKRRPTARLRESWRRSRA